MENVRFYLESGSQVQSQCLKHGSRQVLAGPYVPTLRVNIMQLTITILPRITIVR